MKNRLLHNLAALVACDTQNPPRQIDGDHEIFRHITRTLHGFNTAITDHGEGRVSLHARRGEPRTLFNVHLDTVPVGEGWTRSPFELAVVSGQAFGRGACDIKGAAACLLTLAEHDQIDLALLFTTDEEGTAGCCVQEFCGTPDASSYELVVVAEPTQCHAVTQHRGYLSAVGEFSGTPGHTSQHRDLVHSAVHKAIGWASHALHQVAEFENRLATAEVRPSCCFNIGRLDGGVKNNVIADRCSISWSARPPSGVSAETVLALVNDQSASDEANWRISFHGPSLPVDFGQLETVDRLIQDRLKRDPGPPVDFWTEASLFSAAGCPAIVLGPGDIRQAHTSDEWVSVSQLLEALELYRQLAT